MNAAALSRLSYLESIVERCEQLHGPNSEQAERAVRILIDFQERNAEVLADLMAKESRRRIYYKGGRVYTMV